MNEKPLAEELGRADDAIYFLDAVGQEDAGRASIEVQMPTWNRQQRRQFRRMAKKRKGYTR